MLNIWPQNGGYCLYISTSQLYGKINSLMWTRRYSCCKYFRKQFLGNLKDREMYKTRTCYGNCFLGFVKIESIYQAKATEDDRPLQHITHNFCVGKIRTRFFKIFVVSRIYLLLHWVNEKFSFDFIHAYVCFFGFSFCLSFSVLVFLSCVFNYQYCLLEALKVWVILCCVF